MNSHYKVIILFAVLLCAQGSFFLFSKQPEEDILKPLANGKNFSLIKVEKHLDGGNFSWIFQNNQNKGIIQISPKLPWFPREPFKVHIQTIQSQKTDGIEFIAAENTFFLNLAMSFVLDVKSQPSTMRQKMRLNELLKILKHPERRLRPEPLTEGTHEAY